MKRPSSSLLPHSLVLSLSLSLSRARGCNASNELKPEMRAVNVRFKFQVDATTSSASSFFYALDAEGWAINSPLLAQ